MAEDPAAEVPVESPVMDSSWYGTPMEEVDPLIFDDTFCVISKKYDKHYIYRYSCTKSLFLLGPMNPIRRFAIFVTTHRFFDIIIILTILCNCVTLAMITNQFDPLTDEKITPQFDETVDHIEYVFLGIYSCELVLKVLAKGLVLNRFSYLRNRWNFLDFVVVMSGYITLIKDLQKGSEDSEEKGDNALDFLRTFRVLRVVKTISIMPGLKMMINALLSSVVHLLEVMVLTLACLMIFSLFALELFQGRLRQKCVVDKGGPEDPDRILNRPIAEEDPEDRDRVWTEWVSDWKNWKRRSFPEDEPTFCGNGSRMRQCGEGYTCIGPLGNNPDNGWSSFETFFTSMLSTFQLLTLDYWERLYDMVVSTCGVWSLLFFILVIFLGAYYLLNLMLAVVAMSYENEASMNDQGPVSAQDKLGLNRRQSNFSFDDLTKLNVCKMTNYRKRTRSEREALAKRIKQTSQGDDTSHQNIHLDDAIFSLLGMKLAANQEKEMPAGSFMEGEEETGPISNKDPDNQPSGSEDDKKKSESGQAMAAEGTGEGAVKASQSVHTWRHKASENCKKWLQPVVNHTFFETFITLCIIANTITLAMEHHGESRELEEILKMFNNVFMTVFSLECVLKLLALQKEYFHKGWNIFDFIIVVVSYLDLAVANIGNGSKSGGLSVIRSMRLLRVFKLAQSWVTMKVLLNIIFSSFGALGNLTAVLIIVIYIFAVMGMQVIGEQYNYGAFGAQQIQSEFPQWHWRHFGYAFMIVFRVLCGEWIEVLWECLQAQEHYINNSGAGGPKKSSILPYMKCFIIYLPILIVGNFIVLNLFLALLLNSFDTEELNAQREKELEAQGKAEKLNNIVGLLMKKEDEEQPEQEQTDTESGAENQPSIGQSRTSVAKRKSRKTVAKGGKKGEVKTQVKGKGKSNVAVVESAAKIRFKAVVNKVILRIRIRIAERAIARMENRRRKRIIVPMTNKLFLGNPASSDQGGYPYDQSPEDTEASEDLSVAGDCIPAKIMEWRFCPCRSTGKDRRQAHYVAARHWDNIRSFCVIIVGHSAFEWTILLLIFCSSITLCFEDIHLEQKPELRRILCILNYTFSAIFLIEMLLKWFAIGIWGYFTNFWTILDAFIVLVSLVSAYFDLTLDTDGICVFAEVKHDTPPNSGGTNNLGALKALRTLRALRPLRAISRWQGMKIVVNALMYAIPSIFNVLLVCLLFWLIFSIMGVQFFKGQFFRCVNAEGERVDWRLVPNKDVCCAKSMTHGYSWVNTISNYDNVFAGYLSLLQVATFEGWIELMSYSVDAVGVDKQPSTDFQIGYYGFYVVFIIFGSFFTLQLFIGVIIDNFNMLKKKYEGNMLEILLTPTQRNYYIAMKNLGKKKPKPIIDRPKSKTRAFFYDIAMSRSLEIVVIVMIFLNLVMAALEYFGQSQMTIHIMSGCNAFFTTVYILEAFIKIYGLGTFYFMVPSNVYDFVLVGTSIMDVVVIGDLEVTLPIPPTMLRVIRLFRIGRILRRVQAAQGIRKLLFALVVSLPALFNIGALLALITFIYAILGMALFGKAPRKWSVDEVFNFETFLNSNLMLIRLMTAAGWNEVLDSLTVLDPECGSYRHIKCGIGDEPECPNRGLVVGYIVTYLILTYLIVINLYIAIILENYVEASNEEDVGIVEDDMEMFYIRWSRYDPYATQFIDFDDLTDFLDSLEPPLQLPKPNIVAIVAFNLPIARGNKLHCLDILQCLITHVLGQVDDSREFRKLQNQMEHKFQKQFPTRRLLDIVSSTRRWKIEQNAAIIIQRAWRAYWRRTHPELFPAAPTQENQATVVVEKVKETGHGGMGHMMKRMGNVQKGGETRKSEDIDADESIDTKDTKHHGKHHGKHHHHKKHSAGSASTEPDPDQAQESPPPGAEPPIKEEKEKHKKKHSHSKSKKE